MELRRGLAGLAICLGLTGSASGQELWTARGGGRAVAVLGDVNGDGVADVASAEPYVPNIGEVLVLSGADGTVLWNVFGTRAHPQLGRALVAVEDKNADGVKDLLVGADEEARLLSGVDGATLLVLTGNAGDNFGYSVATVPDTDGDGEEELVVGAPQTRLPQVPGAPVQDTGPGYVAVYSGATGAPLQQWFGPGTQGSFGGSLARVGDADGDGVEDLGVSTFFEPFFWAGPARLRVYSGASGVALLDQALTADGHARLAAHDDVTGDGRGEVVLGQPFLNRVRVVSGGDGSLVYQDDADNPSGFGLGFGQSVARLPDVNGDGVADLACGAGHPAHSGFVRVLSGARGTTLYTILGPESGTEFGASVASLPDADGDGLDDLLVGAPASGEGGVAVHSAAVPTWSAQTYCPNPPNSTGSSATLGFTGTLSLTAWDLVLIGEQLTPFTNAVVLYGPERTSVPWAGALLCVGEPVLRLSPGLLTDGTGGLAYAPDPAQPPLTTPAGTITAGSTWHFQVLYREPSATLGTLLSEALSLTFIP